MWINVLSLYSKNTNLLPPKPKSSFRHLKQGIQELHGKYVLVPADKAANNVVAVCRLHYINTVKQELNGTKAYEETTINAKSEVYSHSIEIPNKCAIDFKERQDRLSKMSGFDVFFLLEIRKRKRRSHGKRQKGNDKRKRCAAQKSGTSLNNILSKLREHGRHAMLSFLSSLPIPVLCVLDIEANRFYVRNHQMYEAALLTRCYTQHALRPFIDAEINHQRHFIKIPFINKGMGFIDLPSIFQDKSVTSSIPDYFQNSEPPIICYKYNKPIRHTIFNFNKLVSDLDIHANTPSS